MKPRWIFNRTGGIALGLGLLLTLAVTGCVGYVDGGYVGGAVVAPAPDVTIFAGGHDDHWYGHRGYDSRHWHR